MKPERHEGLPPHDRNSRVRTLKTRRHRPLHLFCTYGARTKSVTFGGQAPASHCLAHEEQEFMARRTRNDGPDTWHHVMNRAIARRSLFETPEDIRFFLAGVARAVRRGHLEVHAWCVLTTHFHMLVRSPQGRLSEVMRLQRNARLADGHRDRQPCATAACVSGILWKLAYAHGHWHVPRSRRVDDGWEFMHAGLPRDFACASYPQAAQRLCVSADRDRRLAARHRQLLHTNDAYGRVAADTTRTILTAVFEFVQAG